MRQKRVKQATYETLSDGGVLMKPELLDFKETHVYLEIGSGKGLFITSLAKDHPENRYVALEVNINVCYRILEKKEATYALLTGLAIDKASFEGKLDKEASILINTDNSLYGVDEILALSIVNIYGSIALTNFGYLDKKKPGIIGELDKLGKEGKACTTFIDDIVCAVAAAAASKMAHSQEQKKPF